MVLLIKKGGLRERANRSRSYKGSENTEATLQPNCYAQSKKDEVSSLEQAPSSQEPHSNFYDFCIANAAFVITKNQKQPARKNVNITS